MSDSHEEVAVDYEEAMAGQEAMDDQDNHNEHDVFIVYCGDDKALADAIVKLLEQHPKTPLKCRTQDTFQPGKPVFSNITDCMAKAKRTLLILTKDTLKSPWVKLEVVLALERSQEVGSLILRLGLSGVEEKDIQMLKKGMLEKIPHITVDLQQENWEDHLVQSILDDITLPDILPVGCLAHGQVFSHFSGFLQYILPDLKEQMERSQIYREKPSQVSTKLFILLPESCKIHKTLECKDPQKNIVVTQLKEKLKFEPIHAGKPRCLDLTIYRAECGDEEYFFVGDMPNVLGNIYAINEENLAEIDIPFQIERFYYTLGEVINHKDNQKCRNTVKIIRFNDSTNTIADVIYSAVKEDITHPDLGTIECHSLSSHPQDETLSRCEYDAVIISFDDCPLSKKEAEHIERYLRETGKKVTSVLGNAHNIAILEHGRWNIFVFSKEVLQNDNILTYQCRCMLVQSVHDNALRVLPVLVDVEPDELPSFIKWVTLLKVTEPRYLDKLLQTLNGGIVTMEHRLPSGDVATGLSWGYVINYLTKTLLEKDFKSRIERFLREKNINCACILKMFILVPKTCTTHPDMVEQANAGYPEGQGPLKHLGNIEPVCLDAGGQIGRTFLLHMYQYSGTSTPFCFIAEYCTPIHCLHEMANTYPFAGLLKADMDRQSMDFVQKVEENVNREAVKKQLGDVSKLIKLVRYDDVKTTLMQAFEEHIKYDDFPMSSLVFAEKERPKEDH